MNASDQSFLSYYLQELSSLEDGCAEFAELHPQVAGNLGLGSEGAADPHLRQLIESVAFIAARLKRQIDAVPGELAHGLLHAAAPHLIAPVPSMSIARLFPMSDQLDVIGTAPPGLLRLRATSGDGDCFFSGCMSDVKLWPLKVEVGSASRALSLSGALPPGCEEFSLQLSHPRRKILQGAPGELTFFISGALNRALAAIDALALGLVEMRMIALDGTWVVPVARDQLDILGFRSSHRLIPEGQGAFHSGPLALEFLNFPRRFCFFKIRGLHCPVPSTGFFLSFIVKRPWLVSLDAVKEHIHLNCVPVINLYTRPPVALRLEDAWREHSLPRGEVGRGCWDVFSVNRVQLVDREERLEIPQFHSGIGRGAGVGAEGVFWQAIRRERTTSSLGHAGLALRFVGLEHLSAAKSGGLGTALVDATYTNCEAPESLQAAQPMEVLGWEGGYHAKLEFVPTPYVHALTTTSASTTKMLGILQSRSDASAASVDMVHQYLAAHDRTQSAHAKATISALQNIERRLVAMPRSDAPLGAMLCMGCQYMLNIKKGVDKPGSDYLLKCLAECVLGQMHDASLPFEVLIDEQSPEELNVI